MRNKSRAVYFQHKYIVDNPYFTTLHELHPSLVAQCIDGEADAVAGIYMPRLGKKTDVERQARHASCCLWRVETSDTLSCARIGPLPLLYVAAKFGVGLCYAHFLKFEF